MKFLQHLGLLFFCLPLVCCGSDSEKIKSFVDAALQATERTNVKKVIKDAQSPGNYSVTYRFWDPQANMMVFRSEVWVNNRLFSVAVKNAKGCFYYDPATDSVIDNQMNAPTYNGLLGFDFMFSRLRWNYGCEYTVENAVYHNINCYKVVITAPVAAEDRARMIDRDMDYWNKNYAAFKPYFLNLRIVYIGRANHFIYGCEFFNDDGAKIWSDDWSQCEIIAQFDPALFELPAAKKTVKVTTPEAFTKALIQKNQGPGWFSQCFNFLTQAIDNNFDSISKWGSRITLYLAILAAVVAVGLKVRSRRLSGNRDTSVRQSGNGRGSKH